MKTISSFISIISLTIQTILIGCCLAGLVLISTPYEFAYYVCPILVLSTILLQVIDASFRKFNSVKKRPYFLYFIGFVAIGGFYLFISAYWLLFTEARYTSSTIEYFQFLFFYVVIPLAGNIIYYHHAFESALNVDRLIQFKPQK